MKIIPYKIYLKEKMNKEEPLCPKCKVSMEFDVNILKDNSLFREGHEDALFECESCRGYYLVQDYTDKKEKGNEC